MPKSTRMRNHPTGKKGEDFFWVSLQVVKGLQRDVVYLNWPLAPSLYERYEERKRQNAGAAGYHWLSAAVRMEPNETLMIELRVFRAVLRIHDILGWIRIRGSMPLTTGSGSGSCYFHQWPSRCQQKTNILTQFFLLSTFQSYIYIIFQK